MESENLMLAWRHSSRSLPPSLSPPCFSSFFLACLFSFLLSSSPILHSLLCLALSLSPTFFLPLSFLAEPYCIQTQQPPYKAAQLNMSHIIYPQWAASSPFTAHTWIICKRGRRGQLNSDKLLLSTASISHSDRECICVDVNKC